MGPTAQGYKQQFSHAKAKPKAESSNRTASGAVNRSGSVCPLEKRAGKTKSGVSTPVKTKEGSSGVSTPVKTKKGSSKKQDTPTSRANAKGALDPSDANEFTAEVITERGRAGRIAGSTSLPPLAKRPRSLLGKKSWATILRMRFDGEIFVRRLWGAHHWWGKVSAKDGEEIIGGATAQGASQLPSLSSPAHPQNFQRSLKAALGYPGGAPRFTWARIPTTSGDRSYPQTSVVQLKRSEPSSSCPACHPHTNPARAPRTPYTFIM